MISIGPHKIIFKFHKFTNTIEQIWFFIIEMNTGFTKSRKAALATFIHTKYTTSCFIFSHFNLDIPKVKKLFDLSYDL